MLWGGGYYDWRPGLFTSERMLLTAPLEQASLRRSVDGGESRQWLKGMTQRTTVNTTTMITIATVTAMATPTG